MSKELIFSQALAIGIKSNDISIWNNSLLTKILGFLSSKNQSLENIVKAYEILCKILNHKYQYELHSMRSNILESINFKQINNNLQRISTYSDSSCQSLAEKFSSFGVPVLAFAKELSAAQVGWVSSYIGVRITISDGLDSFGNWYNGDNSYDYKGANLCYQIPSLGINPYPIYEELTEFAKSISISESKLITQVANSYRFTNPTMFRSNQLVSYEVGFSNHVVGFSFYQPFAQDHGYIMYCNRANQDGNTNVYYIGCAQQITYIYNKFCRTLQTNNSNEWYFFINEELNKNNNFLRIQLPSKSQKNANCAYANPKSLVLGSLNTLYVESGYDSSSALNHAYNLYKRYTKFARLNCIATLIHKHETAKHDIERKILQKIACKILLYYQRKFSWEKIPSEIKQTLLNMISKIFGDGENALQTLEQIRLLGMYEPYHRNKLIASLYT